MRWWRLIEVGRGDYALGRREVMKANIRIGGASEVAGALVE